MYLWSQKQTMPLTPGIEWTRDDVMFRKRVLGQGVSLGQLQWLYYLQETDFCRDSNGNRIQIKHAYFHGEHKVGKFYCDGYLEKDGQKYFLEYNGKLLTFLNL